MLHSLHTLFTYFLLSVCVLEKRRADLDLFSPASWLLEWADQLSEGPVTSPCFCFFNSYDQPDQQMTFPSLLNGRFDSRLVLSGNG